MMRSIPIVKQTGETGRSTNKEWNGDNAREGEGRRGSIHNKAADIREGRSSSECKREGSGGWKQDTLGLYRTTARSTRRPQISTMKCARNKLSSFGMSAAWP